jgi:MYXO-CTERM domain-containing protein
MNLYTRYGVCNLVCRTMAGGVIAILGGCGTGAPGQLSEEMAAPAQAVQPSAAPTPKDLTIDAITAAEEAKLLASDGTADDELGYAVSVSGDMALVGAPNHLGNVTKPGSAYVFVRSGGTWTEQAKLSASDGAVGDKFGYSVSISGNTALVGAAQDDDNGQDSGSAYVFVQSGGTWTEQVKLVASDGAAGDFFGFAVSLSGDTALVAAPNHDDNGTDSGAAYVFVRSGGTWSEQAKLVASDGAASDRLGYSVSVSGDTALVGASGDDDNGFESGSAYVFVQSGGTWSGQAKLLASDGAANSYFGFSVSVEGDAALVGVPNRDDNGMDSGAAYVFDRSGGTWTEQAKLLASDGTANDQLGISVSLSGNTALLGAVSDDEKGTYAGSAYVFEQSGGMWTQQVKLLGSDEAAGDNFGWLVSLSGNTALIGAPLRDDSGGDSGSAYVFALQRSDGVPCVTGAECMSGFCSDGVCCDSACGNGDPNDCQACSVAAGAMADGTCAPVAMGTVCRASSGECDTDESCDGTAVDCPADMNEPNGTTCTGGTCMDGLCEGGGGSGGASSSSGAGGGSASSGTGATGGSSGSGTNPGEPNDESGCACHAVSSRPSSGSHAAFPLLALALLAARRRSRTLRS